jgi:hypothetical protein
MGLFQEPSNTMSGGCAGKTTANGGGHCGLRLPRKADNDDCREMAA